MGAPRYRPRDFCDYPAEFGNSPHLKFAPLPSLRIAHSTTPADSRRALDNKVFAVHASWQNEHSIAIRKLLKQKGLTLGEYGRLIDQSQSTVGAKLRGTAVMNELDVERANILFKGNVRLIVRMNQRRMQHDKMLADIREIENSASSSADWPAWDSFSDER